MQKKTSENYFTSFNWTNSGIDVIMDILVFEKNMFNNTYCRKSWLRDISVEYSISKKYMKISQHVSVFAVESHLSHGDPIDSPIFFQSYLDHGPPSPKHHRDHQYVQRALLVLPNILSHCRSPYWQWKIRSHIFVISRVLPILGVQNVGKKPPTLNPSRFWWHGQKQWKCSGFVL